jgi:hypothetical protein
VLTTGARDSSARLEAIHREAAARLGYQPVSRTFDRFNLDHVQMVREAFANVERFVRDDAFIFPSTEVTLRYYASGMIDAIADPPADGGHRSQLLSLVAERGHPSSRATACSGTPSPSAASSWPKASQPEEERDKDEGYSRANVYGISVARLGSWRLRM